MTADLPIELLSLYLLAVVDGSFVGYRDVVGRVPLLQKTREHATSYFWGFGLVHVMLALIALAVVIAISTTGTPELLIDELSLVTRRMLIVYGAYALSVVATFGLFALPIPELRGFVTLGIFGMLTLIRPMVILGGAAWSAWHVTRPEALGVVAVIALTMAPLQWIMTRSGVNAFDWSFAFEDHDKLQ